MGAKITHPLIVAEAECARESEQLYRSVFENLSDGVVVASGLKILLVNEAFLKIHGLSDATTVPGMSADLLVAPEDRERFRHDALAWQEGEQLEGNAEYRILRPDGEQRLVRICVRRIIHHGQTAALAVLHDVTDQEVAAQAMRENEERLRQGQRMEAVGMLAGGVAHDFNNLLTAIIGFSALVDAKLPEGDQLKGYMSQVMKAGHSAANLTSQLLAFSRKQLVAPEVLSLNIVVADVAKLCERVIGENIHLATSLEPDLALVMADRGMMEQILMNLAVNARDAMPEGGTLTIETANVDLDEVYFERHGLRDFGIRQAGRHVHLAVSDDGIGMDRETQAKIFQPFFTTKEPGKGTGIGLSTVYGIVKQSGGDIWVDSVPGRGTRFDIYLPTHAGAGELPRLEPPTDVSGGSETILLVEDEVSVRALLRAVLEAKAYRVLEAGSGEEALQVAQRHDGPIDLLVTDLILPGMSGRKLSERFLDAHSGHKVLFISGYIGDMAVGHGMLAVQMDFLQKPFTPSSLAQKVRDLLDRVLSPPPRAGEG